MTLTRQTISTAASSCIASFLIRMDKNARTRYCGYEEAQRLVGSKKLVELLQGGEVEYHAPRTDAGNNAKWRIRRLHLLPYTRPVANAAEQLANNIN